ncbi:MAG: PQQ-binding-like beta-propeller repeat protein [Planctomycetes bacterium]|nr:PQQ-binding-like beta-propeller repeat protein [Planctomycetota bacterium]
MTKRALALAIVTVSLSGLRLCGADWPQWRGPNRDGLWRETGLVQKFDHKQLPVRWRAKISNGYSGPTVADRRVYVTDRVTKPTQLERVHCFDAMDGAELWSYEYECEYVRVDKRDGPRAAVTVNDGRAYSLGTMADLFCFDAAKGEMLWRKNLKAEYKIRMPFWGIAAAPLVEDGLLIVHIGGRPSSCLVAFDKVTGKEEWRALEDPASYSAPIAIEQAGKRVLVCWTGKRLVGLNPLTGKLYWQHPFPPARMIHNIVTPVFQDNYLFVSEFFSGSLLLKVHPDKLAVEKVWRRKGANERLTDSLHCCISTPILQGNYIYGVDSYGQLRCLDLHTGDRIWESQAPVPNARWATIHLVRQEDKVWMFNERGELIISKLSPKGYHEISRARLISPTAGQLDQRGGVCWAHPAFAYKHVYVRNDEELICADLSAAD